MGRVIISSPGFMGIDPDNCTATQAQVLSGYSAGVNGFDDPVWGTMPNHGQWTSRIGVNGRANIPAGYHNGNGYVDQSITNRGAWNSTIGINGTVTIPEGYHNGQGKVTQSIPTLSGQTITPSANQQTINCSGNYMTGNVVVNGVNVFHKIETILITRNQVNSNEIIDVKYDVPSQYRYNSLLLGLAFNSGIYFASRGIANMSKYQSRSLNMGSSRGAITAFYKQDFSLNLTITNLTNSQTIFRVYLLGGFDDIFDPVV